MPTRPVTKNKSRDISKDSPKPVSIFFKERKKIDKVDGGAGTDAGIDAGTSTSAKKFALTVQELELARALWVFRNRCRSTYFYRLRIPVKNNDNVPFPAARGCPLLNFGVHLT